MKYRDWPLTDRNLKREFDWLLLNHLLLQSFVSRGGKLTRRRRRR